MSNEAVETETKGPLTLELHYDEVVEDPRKDREHVGRMICWHRQADLGDETVNTGHYESMNDLVEDFAGEDAIVMPLFLYEHSGMTMSTSNAGYPFNDQWDAGQVGFIYVDRKTIAKEFTAPRYDCTAKDCKFYVWGSIDGYKAKMVEHLVEHFNERWSAELTVEQDPTHGFDEVPIDQMVRECLAAEVEEYDQYLRGDVYGYVIKDDHGETLDSCWGFFGYDYALESAREALEAEHEHLTTTRAEAEKHARLIDSAVIS